MRDHLPSLIPPIADRWSPLAFDPERVPDQDELVILFEAARVAPSCFNEQPWDFIVGVRAIRDAGMNESVTEETTWGRLLATLTDKNKSWARSAPVLCLSVARMTFAYNGKPNRWAMHDTGMAVANLYTQATAMGLFVHQMAGFDRPAATVALGIPEGHEAVAMMAIGYLGDPAQLPDGMAERNTSPRERKPAGDFLHGATWDSPANLRPEDA